MLKLSHTYLTHLIMWFHTLFNIFPCLRANVRALVAHIISKYLLEVAYTIIVFLLFTWYYEIGIFILNLIILFIIIIFLLWTYRLLWKLFSVVIRIMRWFKILELILILRVIIFSCLVNTLFVNWILFHVITIFLIKTVFLSRISKSFFQG